MAKRRKKQRRKTRSYFNSKAQTITIALLVLVIILGGSILYYQIQNYNRQRDAETPKYFQTAQEDWRQATLTVSYPTPHGSYVQGIIAIKVPPDVEILTDENGTDYLEYKATDNYYYVLYPYTQIIWG